eukprot:8249232-Ditylum_brightwellii.AAC.1
MQFGGYRHCKADVEGLLDVKRKSSTIQKKNCTLFSPGNIQVQELREPLVQSHAKNPNHVVDRTKDMKRK